MSYSFQVPAGPKASIADRVAEAFEAYADTPQGDSAVRLEDLDWWPAGEVRDHVDRVTTALGTILEVVGQADDQVLVSITGHANPDHAPKEGYSNETVSINISVVSPAT